MKLKLIAGWFAVLSSTAILNAAPFLEGTVTDDRGRPIEGASVKIWDCIGTCFGGKTVLTDAGGHYVFPEKPFRNYPLLDPSMPGRYVVSRHQTGPALHEPDTDVPRRADFVLGTPAAATVRLKADVPEGWTPTLTIRAGRDVALHRYDVSARHASRLDYWLFDMLPRNESLHLVFVVKKPAIEESNDPETLEQRQRQNWRNRVEVVSPPIRLPDPQRYDVRASVTYDDESETCRIVVELIRDAVGTDRTAELIVSDPAFGPPVDAAAREQALALLERVKNAAVPWNSAPPLEIASYDYDAVDAEGETTHVRVDRNSPSGPGWSDIARQRGVAYMPPLRWLFSQPENVVFHRVEIGDDRAVLHYRLKSGRGFGAGLGVGPGWNGFFTTSFSSGTIVIDVPRAVVLEHRMSKGLLGEESVETFGDYVAVDQGYAPRSLRIQSGQDFRLSFRIHKERLWLLDRASRGDEQQPCFRIENVVVNMSE